MSHTNSQPILFPGSQPEQCKEKRRQGPWSASLKAVAAVSELLMGAPEGLKRASGRGGMLNGTSVFSMGTIN